MATGLGDKLHLALEQVKKKKTTTWGVQFSWQFICLNSAKEHSTAGAGATQICLVLPLSPTAEKGANTRLRFLDVQPTASELFSLPHHPRESREGSCSTLYTFYTHVPALSTGSTPKPSSTHSPRQWQFTFPFLFCVPWKPCPPERSMELQPQFLRWRFLPSLGRKELSMAKKWSLGNQTQINRQSALRKQRATPKSW